jgi:hypothetical protein
MNGYIGLKEALGLKTILKKIESFKNLIYMKFTSSRHEN